MTMNYLSHKFMRENLSTILEKIYNHALDHRGSLHPHFRVPALFYTTKGRRSFSLFLFIYRVTYRGCLHRYVR